jgi:uncharacterized protein YndB with AHSA1/START domain
MAVKKDASGRRSIQVEVEVPGTPEEVWQAIATGAGVSSWFVPTEVEERLRGTVTAHFGPDPGMDAIATITAWDPPRRFAAESRDFGVNAPPIATEWTIEARGGGTCIVRVVHSLFASTDDWDDQLESIESGWPAFFRVLRLYMAYFRGQRCSAVHVLAMSAEPESKVWATLAGALGLTGATKGDRRAAPLSGAPPLAGIVENVGEGKRPHQFILRLDEPAPGLCFLHTFDCGGPVMASIGLYLFGDRAPAVVARDQALWQAWMNAHFRAVADARAAGGTV